MALIKKRVVVRLEYQVTAVDKASLAAFTETLPNELKSLAERVVLLYQSTHDGREFFEAIGILRRAKVLKH